MQMPGEARIEESVPVNAVSDKEREKEKRPETGKAGGGAVWAAGAQGGGRAKETTRRKDWTAVILTEGVFYRDD